MVERSLPAVLKLAAGDENHIGLFETSHVGGEVAAIPRRFHPVNDGEDGGAFLRRTRRRSRCCDQQQGEPGRERFHNWNCPTITVWQRPPRSTRSPSSRQRSTPVRLLA